MQTLAYSKHRDSETTSPYLPDFIAQDVMAIDFVKLRSLGIRHVVFDLDQTLRRAYSRRLESEIIAKLQEIMDSKLFASVTIMTNNQLSLRRFNQDLNLRTFQPYWRGIRIVRKPNVQFFQKVLDELGAKPQETVMIGDKVKADVLGANKVGMRTVLVKPLGRDYWFNTIILARIREARNYNKALEAHHKHNKK